jgi:hypothetical protein
MADSTITFSDVSDLRYNPFTGAWTPKIYGWGGATPAERRTVPAVAPYWIKLFELPKQDLPATLKVVIVAGAQLTEVPFTQIPGATEFRVNYTAPTAGIVEFNSAQAGIQMDIHYSGLGHNLNKTGVDAIVFGGTQGFAKITLSDTTDATTKDLGSLVTEGGIAAEKQLFSATKIIARGGFVGTYSPPVLSDYDVGILTFIAEIGPWNMDTTATLNISFNPPTTKLLSISVIIIQDNGTDFYDLNAGGKIDILSLNFGSGTLSRTAAGIFDNANFDNTAGSYNRGYITGTYIP